jgi:predicted permease
MFPNDFRYAVRGMKDAPGFTIAAIVTLALGLGINSAVLSIAQTVFLKPVPVPDAARLVLVDQTLPKRPPTSAFTLSYPDYVHYRDHARSFEGLAAHYATSPMHISRAEGGLGVLGSVVTSNYFGVLQLQPAAGRFFTDEETRVPGQHPVAVLSHELWRTRFTGDSAILGASLRVNGTAFTVIGIAPPAFRGIYWGMPVDVWIPTSMFSVGYRYCDGFARNCRILGLIGRLRDGVSMRDAQSELTVLAGQLETAFPETNTGRGVVVRPARGLRVDEQTQNRTNVGLLAAAAGLVLLVSSANVAGLLLARGVRRRKEVAIRLALGASRGQLIRQLLVESTLLATAGGVAGLIVAVWASDVSRGFIGAAELNGASYLDVSLNGGILAAGFAIALVTGVATGIAPALQSTRGGALPALKDDGAGSGTRRTRMREALIVGQVAVSVLLIAASGLVVRSFIAVHRGPGFDPQSVVLTRLRPSLVGYSAERAWAFQREVIRRLEEIPGVVSVSPANIPALPGWRPSPALPIQVPGAAIDPSSDIRVGTTSVGPRFFQTLGVSLVEGREFDERDGSTRPRVAIVNEAMARRFWPQGGVAGRQVTIDGAIVEIVGVVQNIQFLSVRDQPEPTVYFSFWQQNTAQSFTHDAQMHIRVAGDAAALLLPIRRAIAATDPDVPAADAQVLGTRLNYSVSNLRAARVFLITFGALALVLSTIGLYAALAFTVGQRTRDIAIRMALGAARLDVGRLILQRGALVVAIGALVGVAASAIAGPLLAHLLYGVGPRDPLTLAVAPLLVSAVALLAIWVPTRRAMAMDPMIALRSQ